MASSSSNLWIGSVVLLVATAGTALVVMSSRNGGNSNKEDQMVVAEIDDDDEDEMNFITADEVSKVFERLFLEMQAVVAQLGQTVQQIQMSGQVIPEQQLRQLLKSEFERALTVKQQQVLDAFEMDYDCLEEATWDFLSKENEYPKVKKSVERFQRLFENISGETVVGKRPGGVVSAEAKEAEAVEILSAAKTIEAAEVYFNSLTDGMGELVKKFKADGKNLHDPSVAQELQMEFSTVANDKGEEALKEIGIGLMQFQKSIEANASNPQVGRALAMQQMKQQQALMSMGVPAG